VRDDYKVESVKIYARPSGGRMAEMPYYQRRFLLNTVAISPSFHQNQRSSSMSWRPTRPATRTYLGTRDKPMQTQRKKGFASNRKKRRTMRNRHLAILDFPAWGLCSSWRFRPLRPRRRRAGATDVRKAPTGATAAPFDRSLPSSHSPRPLRRWATASTTTAAGDARHRPRLYIWYGNWSSNTGPTWLQDWPATSAARPTFNINTTYTDSTNAAVSNSVTFGGAVNDAYSQGTSLSDARSSPS